MRYPARKSGGVGIPRGQARKVNPFISSEGLYQVSGWHFDEAGSLSKWKGFSKVVNGYIMSQLTESAAPAKFTGLCDYAKSSGTRLAIASALTDIYKQNSGVWQSIKSGQTGTVNDLYDFSTLKDILYICNGVDGNLKFDGTNVYNMGITKPASSPTAASGGGGVLTGGYSYKVTFYNSSMNHESLPSAASNTLVTAANQVALTGIPVSADPQVDRRRIYRTTTNGGIWLFLAEIADNVTTTYADNAADSALGIQVEESAFGLPPTAAMLEVYKGFTFMVPKNSSRISFSSKDLPNAVHANDYRDLDPNDGENVTGLRRLQGLIVAFKGDSIWNGSGEDRSTIAFDRKVSGVGSTNHRGIVKVPGKDVLLFPSDSGFYSYNGIVEKYESGEIEAVYRGLNQSRLKYIVGSVYKPLNICYWLASNGASSQNDIMITYDYVQDKWATRPMTNTPGNVAAILRDSSNNKIFYVGGYTGYVWQGDTGYSDDGAALTAEVIDRSHPREEDTEEIKSFSGITVWFKPQSSTSIGVSYAIDDPDGSYVSVGTIDASLSRGHDTVTFDAQGSRLYPKFTNAETGQPVTIRGWDVRSQNTGRVIQ